MRGHPDEGEEDEEPVALVPEPAAQAAIKAALLSRALRAVDVLASLMECRGRQSMVALGAARTLLEQALKGTVELEDVTKLTDEQLLARRARES